LSLADLTLHTQPSVRVMGKGRRQRVLPLWKETAGTLRAWLKVRGKPKGTALFQNARGELMTRSGFKYIVKKYLRIASVKQPSLAKKRVSPHSLRHSCAMSTLQATGDIRKVALWLGHASLQSTEVYLYAPSGVLKTGQFRACYGGTPHINGRRIIAHVAACQTQIHSDAARQVDHARNAANTVPRIFHSTPELMRSRSPVFSTGSDTVPVDATPRSTKAKRTGCGWFRSRLRQ
jgi:integrase-like protein